MIDPDSYPDDPVTLNMAMLHSPARVFYLRVRLIELNYKVFRRNYEVLRTVLAKTQSPEAFHEMWVMGKEREFDLIMDEVIRLLHNLAASAMTYVDHIRAVLREWYKGTDFLNEYESEAAERFSENIITRFFEDLRNYTLHYALPLAIGEVRFENNPETGEEIPVQTFYLDKAYLLLWKKWKKGKPFLKQAEEQINLLELIDSYYAEVNEFYEWVMDRLGELHAGDIDWLNKMNSKLREALEPLRNMEPTEE